MNADPSIDIKETQTTRRSSSSSSLPSSPSERADAPKPALSLHAVRRLLRLAVPHRRLLLLAGFLTLLTTALSLSIPLLARAALDRVLQSRNLALLDTTALIMFVLIVFGSVVGYSQYLLVAWAGNRIITDLRRQIFAHLQRLPVAFFDRTRSGDLTSLLSNDVSLLQQSLTSDLVDLVGNLIRLFGGVILALAIDWRLTLFVVGLLVVAVAIMVTLGVRLRRYTRESLDALSDAMGSMTEALANVRLTKAFAREIHEDARAETRLERVFRLSLRSSRFEGGMGATASIAFLGVLIGAVWFGGRSVLTGQISGGSLLAFLLTVTIISGPMASLASLYGRLQRALGASERLFALLDDAPEPADLAGAGAFPTGPGSVTFQRVVFAYTPDVPVLRGLDLHLEAGRVTAVVGTSGAGKTTLASLLYRFYERQGGDIQINGVSLDAIRRNDLRDHIGLVPQEPTLFNGTLRDNIRYGKLTATDGEVEQTARDAHVMEFASTFPDGLETVIGERGVTLSGGQRQRVAIARVLLKNPQILVLDEATSALDTRSESLIRDALQRVMQGRTTLVIAHRLATIRDADHIAVLDAGRIVEQGTYSELVAQEGSFAALNRAALDLGPFTAAPEPVAVS